MVSTSWKRAVIVYIKLDAWFCYTTNLWFSGLWIPPDHLPDLVDVLALTAEMQRILVYTKSIESQTPLDVIIPESVQRRTLGATTGFSCGVCFWQALTAAALRSHIRAHVKDYAPVGCQLCNMYFGNPELLTRHETLPPPP